MAKRIFAVVAVVVVFWVGVAEADGWDTLGQDLVGIIRGALPQVTSPALQRAGIVIGASGAGATLIPYGIVIRNGTSAPLIAQVYALGTHIAELGPGGTYAYERYVQTQQESLPLMAFFYEWGPGAKFVGVARKIVYFSSGYPNSYDVTFFQSDILPADGHPYYGLQYGAADLDPNLRFGVYGHSRRIAEIPHEWSGGATIIQIGNSSLDFVEVRVNGKLISPPLAPGGFDTGELYIPYGFSTNYTVQVDYLQSIGGSRIHVGSGSAILPLSTYGRHACQIVVGPPAYGVQNYCG